MIVAAPLAVTVAVWVPAGERPCVVPGSHVARQRLTGASLGGATADVSADGRYVAFVSAARLVPGDSNVVEYI